MKISRMGNNIVLRMRGPKATTTVIGLFKLTPNRLKVIEFFHKLSLTSFILRVRFVLAVLFNRV